MTSVGTSSPQAPTLSISSTAAISRSPSVFSTRTSSIRIVQSTFAPSSFSTQINPTILSGSEVPHSTIIKSDQVTRSTATRSVVLLSKVFTYTDTSTNVPSSTPIVIDETSSDMIATISHLKTVTTVTSSSTKNTLYTSTTDITNDRKTSSTVSSSAVVTKVNTLSAVATDRSNGMHICSKCIGIIVS